jgi:hypothetical protein
MRTILFNLLRAYVWLEQNRVVRWLLGKRPDVVIEPLPHPDVMPEVQDVRSVFVDQAMASAYTTDPNGKTLRRCAQNDRGELVYLERKRLPRSERRALNRAQRLAKDNPHLTDEYRKRLNGAEA